MPYRVDLTQRAARDLERLYRVTNAENSRPATAWFNRLEQMILSLDENPTRGATMAEKSGLRHLLHGRRRHIYRIIYTIDEERRVVTVLHVRHGARDVFRPDAEE